MSVLFGSIILYSLANIANGMVQTVPQYILMRFIAGIGLAGELGASITLVSEMLPKEKRGIAASVIASVGVCGAVTAYFVYQLFHDWRLCFYIGGIMGLLLLILRANVMESSLFGEVKKTNVQRGNFLMLFNNRNRFLRYVKGVLKCCVLRCHASTALRRSAAANLSTRGRVVTPLTTHLPRICASA